MKGARCYVTLFPCNECAKAIIQSGIKEVIYISDKYADTESTIASKKMFNMTGVKYRQYKVEDREFLSELVRALYGELPAPKKKAGKER